MMKSKLFVKSFPVLLVSLSSILGLIGFFIYFKNHDISYNISDLVYAVVKLFIIDSDYSLTHINIFLNVARFLAPLSLATAIIQGVLNLFSSRFNIEKVKRYNDHMIICGDAKSNRLLINDVINTKKGDFIVVKNENNVDANPIKNTIEYQNINTDLLTNIAFYRSRYLFVSFNNDAESLNFAASLLDTINIDQIQKEIDIIILFKNPKWSELSNDLGILRNINEKVSNSRHLNLGYLNYIDKAIRKNMLVCAPDIIRPIEGISDPQIEVGIIGFNMIMQRLIINLALNSHYINNQKLKIYVSHNSSEEFSIFTKEYQLNNILEIVEIDIEELSNEINITAIYICENDELKLMQYMKVLRKSDNLSNVRRFIFIEQSNNITSLLPTEQNHIVDISKEVGIFDNVIDESLDDLAKTIHNDYITKLKETNKLQKDKETHQKWNLLPDEIKDRNRMQADHIDLKLRSLGCEKVNIDSPKEIYDWSNDSRLEALSKAEHNRWMAYMYYKGWKLGDVKDEQKKTHPDLIPYEDLEDYIKQYDRNTIKNIPYLLDVSGYKAVIK
ncbi:MAG: hypothetical protein C0595_11900 [Marinilabiliales bacterium]|nr:MAG: hypothetical protein C0595_11900 [Marinilabiliales bacterium]